MISDPQFAHLHRIRSPISILIRTSPSARVHSRLDLIHVEKSAGSRMRVDRTRFAPQNSIPCSLNTAILINSCNGLICLSDLGGVDGSLYVCNPILGQYISIPSDKSKSCVGNLAAIGFSAKTKEYKVVQVGYRDYRFNEPEIKIYTIGTGVWRSLGKPPRCGAIPFDSFLHGALHWIPYGVFGCAPQSIQSFNFEREEFRTLPLPPVSLKKPNHGFGLGVLKGCLFSCVFEGNGSTNRTADMWIMKDYGVQESWTKILVIENLYSNSLYEPIMFLNDVEILMTHGRKSVVHYNQETKCLQETRIIRTRRFEIQALGYHPCFVSLHDVSNGEEVNRIRDDNQMDSLLGKASTDSACSSVPPAHKSRELN